MIRYRLLLMGLCFAAGVSPAAAQTKPRPGEINTPAARGERIRDRLKEGDAAPDFTLPLVKGKGEVTLSSFRSKRPVVLVFASYT